MNLYDLALRIDNNDNQMILSTIEFICVSRSVICKMMLLGRATKKLYAIVLFHIIASKKICPTNNSEVTFRNSLTSGLDCFQRFNKSIL